MYNKVILILIALWQIGTVYHAFLVVQVRLIFIFLYSQISFWSGASRRQVYEMEFYHPLLSDKELFYSAPEVTAIFCVTVVDDNIKEINQSFGVYVSNGASLELVDMF